MVEFTGLNNTWLPSKACEAPLDVIGQIRADMQEYFKKFEECKARQREIEEEVGKKRRLAEMMGGTYAPSSIEGSSTIPSTDLRDPFQYVAPSDTTQEKGKSKKKGGIQSYFTSSCFSVASNTSSSHLR